VDRYEVEIRQVLDDQDPNTQANMLASLAPMETHEKIAATEVMGKMPMSMGTRLLRRSNVLCLWDRIVMFHEWVRRHQRGIDVVRELYEQPQGLHGLPQELFEPPGIAGLPVLEWKPGHGQPTQRIQAGRPELPQEIKQVILDVLLFLMVTSLAI
jgi:hypothetical protein